MHNIPEIDHQYDLVIMTTAVDRPELHNIVFQNYKQYLDIDNIYWIITVNNICNRVKDSVDTIGSIIGNYKTHFKLFDTGGDRVNWYNSVRYCINHAHEVSTKYGYLWLEDDWLNSKSRISEDLKLLKDESCHVSLAGRSEVSFNPSLWSHDVFNYLMHYSINNPGSGIGARYIDGDNTNPERICCAFPEATRYTKNLPSVNHFYDVGRSWQTNTIKTRTFNL